MELVKDSELYYAIIVKNMDICLIATSLYDFHEPQDVLYAAPMPLFYMELGQNTHVNRQPFQINYDPRASLFENKISTTI